MTSFAAVRRVRALLGGPRCGHAGSLDPFATGLLPIGVGRATRLLRFVGAGSKRYRATVRFGRATDTDDRTGQGLGPERLPPTGPEVAAALPEFVGRIEQRPPAFSAKQVGGKRAYRLARAGKPPALAPVPVRVESLELLGYEDGAAAIACEVGPGTYIRALARDLGERLGCGAHLTALRRTAVGPFRVEGAVRLEDLRGAEGAAPLLDPLAALAGMPRVELGESGVRRLRHGRPAPFAESLPDSLPESLPVSSPDSSAVSFGGEDREPPPGADDCPRAAVRRPTTEEMASGEGPERRLVAVVTAGENGWKPLVVWETAEAFSAGSGESAGPSPAPDG